jgi:hypothetical protein
VAPIVQPLLSPLSLRATEDCTPASPVGKSDFAHSAALASGIQANQPKNHSSTAGMHEELLLTNSWPVWYLLAPHFREIPFPIGW